MLEFICCDKHMYLKLLESTDYVIMYLDRKVWEDNFNIVPEYLLSLNAPLDNVWCYYIKIYDGMYHHLMAGYVVPSSVAVMFKLASSSIGVSGLNNVPIAEYSTWRARVVAL